MVRAQPGEGVSALYKRRPPLHALKKPHKPQGVDLFGSVFSLFCVLIFSYSSLAGFVCCVFIWNLLLSDAETCRLPFPTNHVIMPRCLMAKKWKSYPWPPGEQGAQGPDDEEEEEIDVVGDAPGPPACWGPSSPTAGATAPSPPPQSPLASDTGRVPVIYNGKYVRTNCNATPITNNNIMTICYHVFGIKNI